MEQQQRLHSGSVVAAGVVAAGVVPSTAARAASLVAGCHFCKRP